MIKDYLKFSVNNILHRKIRSWLTVIGIVIGIAAIISLITISQGLQNAIEEQFELFGANSVIISPKGFENMGVQAEGLTQDDVRTLESMSEFKYVSPMATSVAQVEFHDEIKFLTVAALPAEDYIDMYGDMGISTEDGRMFRRGDGSSVILGYRVANKDVFEDSVNIKNKIKIRDEDFKVIGVFEEIGNSGDDNSLYITLDDFRDIYNDQERVDFIMAQAKPGQDIESLKEKIERKLERARGNENFQVMTATQIMEQISSILGIMQFVLVGIAAISLLVGSVGIMNSMYTSVLERTKEIGIMKSIGAKNSDILSLFLIESAFLGLIGGFFGVILGTAIAKLVGFIADQAGFGLLSIKINLGLILFGLFFAIIIGMISGALPAKQASKLKPVDALRYE